MARSSLLSADRRALSPLRSTRVPLPVLLGSAARSAAEEDAYESGFAAAVKSLAPVRSVLGEAPAADDGRLQELEEQLQRAIADRDFRLCERIDAEMQRLGGRPPPPARPQLEPAPAAVPPPTPPQPSLAPRGSVATDGLCAPPNSPFQPTGDGITRGDSVQSMDVRTAAARAPGSPQSRGRVDSALGRVEDFEAGLRRLAGMASSPRQRPAGVVDITAAMLMAHGVPRGRHVAPTLQRSDDCVAAAVRCAAEWASAAGTPSIGRGVVVWCGPGFGGRPDAELAGLAVAAWYSDGCGASAPQVVSKATTHAGAAAARRQDGTAFVACAYHPPV